MNKQIVYIPSDIDTTDAIVYKNLGAEGLKSSNVKETEGYFFTPEQLKQLLEDYTNKIVENVKCKLEMGGEVRVPTSFDVSVNKESITSQLPIFLKEKGYE